MPRKLCTVAMEMSTSKKGWNSAAPESPQVDQQFQRSCLFVQLLLLYSKLHKVMEDEKQICNSAS